MGATPDDRTSWWDYVKAAFNFRFPIKGLGGLPFNRLALALGAAFAFIFAVFARNLTAAGGVVLLTLAYEVAYLYLMTSLPRFRTMVRADRAAAAREALAEGLDTSALSHLSGPARARYQSLVSACREAERRMSENLGKDSAPLAEVLKTGGFADLQGIFLSLLIHRERLGQYLARPAVKALPNEIRKVESDLRREGLPEAVRQSWEGTLEILRKRVAQLDRAQEEYALCEAELDRIDQQVELLCERALVDRDVTDLAAQLDDVVGGINEATDWLSNSERMLASPEGEFDQLRADA